MKKHILLTLLIAIALCAAAQHAAQNAFASDMSSSISLLKPFTVTANESHDSVIEMRIPNTTSIAVAFTGADVAIESSENSTYVTDQVSNKGRTVIIKTSFPSDESQAVTPVHIMTKEGRTHTIALVPLGPKYDKQSVIIKAVIKSEAN